MADDRWNLNIHYHSIILGVAPAAGVALDVGCGDGLLTFDLAERGLRVTGIDPDQASIDRAVSDPRSTERSAFVCDDIFSYPFQLGSFDLVAANAMLHHVDAVAGLRRMKKLVRPGGTIAIVGFARASELADHGRAIAGALFKRARQLRGHGKPWEHNAPIVWPPPLTAAEMAGLAAQELPGSELRPLLSSRYSLTWQAPA